jgi:hypothetical protein
MDKFEKYYNTIYMFYNKNEKIQNISNIVKKSKNRVISQSNSSYPNGNKLNFERITCGC